ncbi:MAG: flagellar hook-associated protein FlgL [Myxococcota bacterium]|jgi:flagellar hook-associated protein 3 FlgL|nr:flagellar hook-associated protein FlgL [Myxococcota bacterium]
MRVSDKRTYDRHRDELTKLRSRFVAAQDRASSGRRVLAPSDDPVATSLALKERSRAKNAEEHARTIDRGRDRLDAADGALGGVADVLRRAQELAVQASSDTVSADERASIAAEIREIRASVLASANEEVGGRRLFGGHVDDAPPFDATGAYVGGATAPELEVAPGRRVAVGLPGDQIFSGPTDVLAVLDDLATALETNDEAGVRAGVEGTRAAHAQVVEARSVLGARSDALETASAVVERLEVRALEAQGELVGVDIAEAYLELERARSAYATAVQIAAQLPGPSLIDR